MRIWCLGLWAAVWGSFPCVIVMTQQWRNVNTSAMEFAVVHMDAKALSTRAAGYLIPCT